MCNPSSGNFSDLLWAIISYWAESHWESCQASMMELSYKNNQWLLPNSECVSDWRCSQCRMSVDCKCLRLDQTTKKSYLWWFRNPACGNSTRSPRTEKDQVLVPPGLVWGKRRGGVVWFSVCEAPLDDWTNGGSVGVFFRYGEYDFSFIWGFKNKIMLYCFKEMKCQQCHNPGI